MNLQDDYFQMSTDHWAVIKGSVRLREAADNDLKSVIDNAKKLVDELPEDGTSPDDTTVIKGIIITLIDNLNTLKTNVDELLNKIPLEDQNTSGEGDTNNGENGNDNEPEPGEI